MGTKAFHRFTQRIGYYDSDIELCNLLVSAFISRKNSTDTIAEDLNGSVASNPVLESRPNTLASRKTCGLHLKATVASAYIKDLYEDFSEYLAEVMSKAAINGIDPARFVGSVKLDIHAKDILAAGDWSGVVSLISRSIFRKLENDRNTKSLIEKASSRLGLNIDEKLLSEAMPYLDSRHILVHQDGTTDQKYRTDYPGIRLKSRKIVTDTKFTTAAKSKITALAADLDAKIVEANLIRTQDLTGNAPE